MNFWKILGGLTVFILVAPFALIAFGILALCGIWFYDSTFFVAQRPTRALEHIFGNPEQAVILKSRQSGAFMIGKNARYVAKILIDGKNLVLLPHIRVNKSRYLREFIDGPYDYCSELLKFPDKELKFYSGDYGNIEVYGVQHLPSHRYCFDYEGL